MRATIALAACALSACVPAAATPAVAPPRSDDPPPPLVLRGGSLPGGERADLLLRDGRIESIGASLPAIEGMTSVDVTGRFLAPAFIDSHVHLAYYAVAEDLARGGIAAAVDLGAPLPFLAARPGPLRVLASGPMITPVAGYPTTSWGADGYGLECADAGAAETAVDTLVAAGAELVKVPLQGQPRFDPPTLLRLVARAHGAGRRVVAHALLEDDVAQALAAGVDLLAHTPVETLPPDLVTGWVGKAVVSTLGAFGGGAAAVDNLRVLHEAGATVLYGTDLGNTRTAAIDLREIELLLASGLDGAAILAAGTATPAAYWGLDDLGALASGKAASLLLLDADPLVDPSTLARPVAVYLDGALLAPPRAAR